MEEKDKILVVAVLDESGSMAPFIIDTVNGYNGFLRERIKETNTRVTTVLFNHQARRLFYRVDPQDALLKPGDYSPTGSTALNDALGDAINNTVSSFEVRYENPFKKVIFLIITDGEENASRRFSRSQLKRQIERTKEKYGFEYLFLGANIDVFKEADTLGIARERTIQFESSERGIRKMYDDASVMYCKVSGMDDLPKKEKK